MQGPTFPDRSLSNLKLWAVTRQSESVSSVRLELDRVGTSRLGGFYQGECSIELLPMIRRQLRDNIRWELWPDWAPCDLNRFHRPGPRIVRGCSALPGSREPALESPAGNQLWQTR